MIPDFFINLGKLFCLFTYSNCILSILCYMYPKFMNKVLTYFKLFAMTILITIGWLAHFGTMGKWIKWTIDNKEYYIEFPRIGDDDAW